MIINPFIKHDCPECKQEWKLKRVFRSEEEKSFASVVSFTMIKLHCLSIPNNQRSEAEEEEFHQTFLEYQKTYCQTCGQKRLGE